MTDAMFEVPQSRLEEMTAELKRLRAQEAHIQDAFARADMPIHWTSLPAAVEEMLRRYLAGQQENNDLRAEWQALKTNLDAARAEAERLQAALRKIADIGMESGNFTVWSGINAVTVAINALKSGEKHETTGVPTPLADIEWLLLGSTDSYSTLKQNIAHICRDVTNAGCIDELCIHDICAGFRQNGYEVIRKEALANLRACPPPSPPASDTDAEQALRDKDLKIAELQERLRRTESANLALRTELRNVRYQWRETIDRSVKLRDKLRGLQAACKSLLDYCRRAGPLGFQLEKANDHLREIETCLAQHQEQEEDVWPTS